MADIAAVFHWPPSEMAAMDLGELMAAHGRAIERYKAMNGNER
jgi:hypothetical protein